MAVVVLAGEQRLARSRDIPVEIDLVGLRRMAGEVLICNSLASFMANLSRSVLSRSVLARTADDGGGAIAGSDRTFDGRGQAGICPIAGEDKIPP